MVGMLAFQHPDYLYLLFLLPMFAGLFFAWRRWQKVRLRRMGDTRLVQAQFAGRTQRATGWRFSFLLLAFAFAVLGAANLRRPGHTAQTKIKGVDVMIALDVSKSMLAADVAPNRL